VAVVAVTLSVSLIIAGYIYTSPLVESRLSIVAEDDAIPLFPDTSLMILCPNRAGKMGLCNMDDRQLHAKYVVTVSPPPIARNPTVTCKVMLEPKLGPPSPEEPRAMVSEVLIPTVDKSSEFTCTHTRIGEDKLELDLAFVGDPDDEQLIASYVLVVTIEYDEPLLSWTPLFTRKVSSAGFVCLLAYNVGKHPPPGTRESQKPLGEFRSGDAAVSWQRQMLGLEPSCEICAPTEFLDNSYVTVHVVDAYGKPIEDVTVSLNTTSCCWIDYRDLSWTGQYISEATDSDGNARFPVTPYVTYTVMVEGVVFSEITAPPPTASMTITVILT